MPVTPRTHVKSSKRQWDLEVREWRRKLHKFDPPEGKVDFIPDYTLLVRFFFKSRPIDPLT